uniref:Uncharacterized protein n=1 Tax=Catharus ustulatus TaxID=91951 RepID=A0A8C3TVR1_CATUS
QECSLMNGINFLPDQNKFTLLRDTRTDGSFLVHHFLSFYLRGGSAAALPGAGTPQSALRAAPCSAECEVSSDKHRALGLACMDP